MKALIPILIAAAGITATASPVEAGGHSHRSVQITTGHFQTLPGGDDLGYDVRGGAIMIRTDRNGGRTSVFVGARGLDPNTVYPVHVHNQPCSATPAGGGHYQHVIGGPVDAVNEIWPKITTDKHGRGTGFATHGARARSDAMSIVIHNPADTSIRLACADLG
jgi:Cu-Zn family superoxide dismutase